MRVKNNIKSFFASFLQSQYSEEITESLRFLKILDDADEALYQVVDSILKNNECKLNNDGYLLDLIDSHKNHFTYRATSSLSLYFDNAVVPHNESLAVSLNANDDIVTHGNIQEYLKEKNNAWTKAKIHSVILIPLIYNKSVFGYFIVVSKKEDAFSALEVNIANMIASFINAAFSDTISDFAQTIKLEEKQMMLEFSEEQRRLAEERQRLIFNSINEAIIIFDFNGCIIDWNPASEKIFGYIKEEVVGKTFTTFVKDEDKYILDNMKDIQEEWHSDINIVRKDGVEARYEMSVMPLIMNNDRIIAVLSVGRDITERYNYEMLQKENTAFLERYIYEQNSNLNILMQALEQICDVVIIIDSKISASDGAKVVYVNNAFENITGYKRSEVIGQTTDLFLDENNQDTLTKIKNDLIEGKYYQGDDITIHTKFGTQFNTHCTISPAKNEKGEITNYVYVQKHESPLLA